MRTAGIIAEYNPFHNGHAWQIAALRAAGFDAVVCVCSPSVVQRGTPALMPIAERARAALAGGADAVLCLPAPFAAAPAQQFAAAGVQTLCALGVCDALAFGTEGANAVQLQAVADTVDSPGFAALVKEELAGGVTFAAARSRAAERLCPGSAALLRTPNNALAVEYLRALAAQRRAHPERHIPQPFALPRVGAAHDAALGESAAAEEKSAALQESAAPEENTASGESTALREGVASNASGSRSGCAAGGGDTAPRFASATALRALFFAQGAQALAPYVPAACLAVYEQAGRAGRISSPAAFSTAVLSRLRAMEPADFAAVRGVREGLENRLAAAVRTAPSVEALYDAMKTKRYSHARLRRLALDAALGYTDALGHSVPYVHILGATPAGRAVLAAARERALLPLDTSLARLRTVSEAAAAMVKAHAAAEDLAALCLASPAPMGGAFTLKFIAAPAHGRE